MTVSVFMALLDPDSEERIKPFINFQTVKPIETVVAYEKPLSVALLEGLNKCSGDFIAVIDADIEINPDFIESALKTFDLNDKIAFCGGSSLPLGDTLLQAEIYGIQKQSYAYGPAAYRYQSHDNLSTASEIQLIGVGVFRATCLREALRDLKEKLPNSAWENTVFTYFISKGYSVIHDPKLNFRHTPQTTLHNYFKQMIRYSTGRAKYFKIWPKEIFKKPYFFLPSLLIFSLVLGIFIYQFAFMDLFYFLYVLVGSGFHARSMLLTMFTHVSYGIGFLYGLIFGKSY